MARSFAKEELYRLRNDVKIRLVIEFLGIPINDRDGVCRFLCPRCGEFQTGVNLKTNLARCFRCEENFNPIDLVMAERGIGFVEAVRFLKRERKADIPATSRRRHSSKPLSTGEILAAVSAAARQRDS